jgi:hypothetical protein
VIALAIAGMAARRVFISYRRQFSEHLAQRVRDNLVEHDFDTYLDLENLDSGEFDRKILSEIEACMHFIVLLQPGSLDRIGEDGDWLRREIAHALAYDRNVIPVTASRFEFHRGLVLPPDVERLRGFQAVDIPSGPSRYFNAAMKELRGKGFLKKTPKPPAPPRPVTRSDQRARATQAPARSKGFTSAMALVLPAPQLTSREYKNPREDYVQLTWSEVPGADEYVLENASLPYPFLKTRPTEAMRGFPDIREVYRGPGRSYNELRSRQEPDSMHTVAPSFFRVRASFSGQAGRWSDILRA